MSVWTLEEAQGQLPTSIDLLYYFPQVCASGIIGIRMEKELLHCHAMKHVQVCLNKLYTLTPASCLQLEHNVCKDQGDLHRSILSIKRKVT